MPSYPVEILQLGRQQHFSLLKDVISNFNQIQNDFVFCLPADRNIDWGKPFEFESYSTAEIWSKLKEYRTECKGFHPFLLAIVNGYLSSEKLTNLFGSSQTEEGIAAFTTHDWSNLFEMLPIRFLVGYYLIRYTISFVCPEIKTHEGSPECFFHKKIDFSPIYDNMKGATPQEGRHEWITLSGCLCQSFRVPRFDESHPRRVRPPGTSI